MLPKRSLSMLQGDNHKHLRSTQHIQHVSHNMVAALTSFDSKHVACC